MSEHWTVEFDCGGRFQPICYCHSRERAEVVAADLRPRQAFSGKTIRVREYGKVASSIEPHVPVAHVDEVSGPEEVKPPTREDYSAENMRRWAQGLIQQLPENHDGRNSWLLNHGRGDEADKLREKWSQQNNQPFPAPVPPTLPLSEPEEWKPTQFPRLIDRDAIWKSFCEHYWDTFDKDRDLILDHIMVVIRDAPEAASPPPVRELPGEEEKPLWCPHCEQRVTELCSKNLNPGYTPSCCAKYQASLPEAGSKGAMTTMAKRGEKQPKMIPNPLYCEKCEGRGYLVGDAEWEPYAVQCNGPVHTVSRRRGHSGRD